MASVIRVGLIGVGNWAAYGHIPALRSLPSYKVVAVSSRKRERAESLAREHAIPLAFDEPEALIEHPELDLVAILPPAPEHAGYAMRAIEARKQVYSEWPLTTSTEESLELLKRAESYNVRHAVGLQRRMGASARYVRDLVREGFLGELRSVRMHVSMEYFTAVRPPSLEWTVPKANFSHVLSIYGGHFFDLLFSIVGWPRTVSAIITPQFPTLTLSRTGEAFPNETPDAVLVQGVLAGGGLYTVQIEGGKLNNSGLQIDFTGTEGDLKVANDKSFANKEDNTVWGARIGREEWGVMPVPARYGVPEVAKLDASVQDLAYLYATYAGVTLAGDGGMVPTFVDGVQMHRFLDTALRASSSGCVETIPSLSLERSVAVA